MSSEQPRKPTILTLQDDVATNRPDLLHTQLELEGYAQELLKLGVDVHTNLLPTMVAIREQESGSRGLLSKTLLEDAAGDLLKLDKFKTLGSFQLNVYDVKRVLSQEPRVLGHINSLLNKYPIRGLSHITNPQQLTYWQLKSLVKNNIYAFYFLNHTLTRTARNLQSKARERGGVYDPKDIVYTTHFAQNHVPQTMYSAIVLQNLLQLARSGPNPIELRDAVDKNYQDVSLWSPRESTKKLFTANQKSRIVLDGTYNEEFVKLIDLLKQKKGIHIQVKTNASGVITKINEVSLIDNENIIDADKGFDVVALKELFARYNYAFYPLLSADFAEENKNRVHDEYNYAFRKYVSNISPEAWAKRFEGASQATDLSTTVADYVGSITYPGNQLEHGVQRDATNCKATSGALDCISWIKYLFLKSEIVPFSYTYLSELEIDAYSYLGGVNEYHHIFAEKLDPNSIHVITPQVYQSNHYFQVISSLHEGDVVGFGQEFPQAQGGRKLTIQQPNPRTESTELDVSMSHGGVVTRVSATNVRVTMSSGEVRKGGTGVVEVPLFGPDGYYEKACLSRLQSPTQGNYKPLVFFGKIDRAQCERSLQERADALGDRQMEMIDGVPAVYLDTYEVYHKAAAIDPVSKKLANYCSEVARVNQQKLLAGTAAKNKIKFADAKQHIMDIVASDIEDGLYQYQQSWGGDVIEPIAYKGFEANGEDIMMQSTYDELAPVLDESRQGYKGYAPLLWDMYIDTTLGHRVTIVYGKYHDVTGYFVIDTLRGPAKKIGGGTGICSLYDYFALPGFYMNDRESPYSKVFLRVKPVGMDMIPDYIPELDVAPAMNTLDAFTENANGQGDENNLKTSTSDGIVASTTEEDAF